MHIFPRVVKPIDTLGPYLGPPVHFPSWQWFRRFVRLFLFRTIHDVALMIGHERAGRSPLQMAAA
jgi:hypothetical protein|tara:strand:- start:2505 stop:2699 length:195 start_codon:yes stop_codon:yes gene_type:complete